MDSYNEMDVRLTLFIDLFCEYKKKDAYFEILAYAQKQRYLL